MSIKARLKTIEQKLKIEKDFWEHHSKLKGFEDGRLVCEDGSEWVQEKHKYCDCELPEITLDFDMYEDSKLNEMPS